jgi:hypothetical protein
MFEVEEICVLSDLSVSIYWLSLNKSNPNKFCLTLVT